MGQPGDRSARLGRFLEAQEPIYATALGELRAGRKRSHWMWFIFPQLAGLGFSATSRYFAIRGKQEALAYLAHPILGERLRECTRAVLQHQARDPAAIFSSPDDLKFRSCMTLFARLAPPGSEFEQALQRFCSGEGDPRTLALLEE